MLVHGNNHFIVRGPLPDRDVARALIRHWSIIQIGVTTPPSIEEWRISTKEFREGLERAVIVPGFLFERAINIGDVEVILALYEPGAVLVAGGKPVTGHDCIRDAFNVFPPMWRSHETRHTGRYRIRRRTGRPAWRMVARPTIRRRRG